MSDSQTSLYEVWAEVKIEVAEGIDLMYWINPDTGQKQHRMDDIYSHVRTEEQLREHLAYNAIFNGVQDASRLDGWGDLEQGDIVMNVNGRIEGKIQ